MLIHKHTQHSVKMLFTQQITISFNQVQNKTQTLLNEKKKSTLLEMNKTNIQRPQLQTTQCHVIDIIASV